MEKGVGVERDFVLVTFMSDFLPRLARSNEQPPRRRRIPARAAAAAAEFRIITFAENSKYYE